MKTGVLRRTPNSKKLNRTKIFPTLNSIAITHGHKKGLKMSDYAVFDVRPCLPEIFEYEAGGILQDLVFVSDLAPLMMFATEAQVMAAKKYIVGVFEECYAAGHLQIMGMAGDDTLYGYAMIFRYPGAQLYYCHKVFVYEQYRGNGIGSQLLIGLLSQSFDVGLICLPELVPFYESVGMICKGGFIAPEADGFKNACGMYAGLSVMCSGDSAAGLPVFLLNDIDIKNMVAAIVTCEE